MMVPIYELRVHCEHIRQQPRLIPPGASTPQFLHDDPWGGWCCTKGTSEARACAISSELCHNCDDNQYEGIQRERECGRKLEAG
jgi:hypothetical protein